MSPYCPRSIKIGHGSTVLGFIDGGTWTPFAYDETLTNFFFAASKYDNAIRTVVRFLL